MSVHESEDANVPWGKYTYALEGLATGCYLEGSADEPHASRSPTPAPSGQRLRFRVELPARCFVLSVAIKLPNAPEVALAALDNVQVERTLTNGEHETVYDGVATAREADQQALQRKSSQALGEGTDVAHVVPGENDRNNESPTAVEATAAKASSATSPSRKKVLEIRRAADALRITLMDIDEREKPPAVRRRRSSLGSEEGSDTGDLRTLGIVVVGYVRGQTPAANRIKILLNASTKLGLESALADRAELNGLLGLGFLSNRRYRQAAELLQRASELVVEVAQEDAKSGCAVDDALVWAAELNLLSAHAFFEHMPMANDGIIQLIQVAAAGRSRTSINTRSPRSVPELRTELLDLRTELLSMLGELLKMLVQFLGESKSLAVKMASARMIEFVGEQLGCAIARHMAGILNQVLRSYPSCTAFGARERAAASSFSYDSMEDCFERLIDICCKLLPLTEHSVLQSLYEQTLVPVFMDGYSESEYLYFDVDVEEVADELMTTAVAQTLRVIYLVLRILGGDARIPTSLVTRILNMLVVESGNPRTPLLLRRSALHTWDVVAQAVMQSASGNDVSTFAQHINVLRDYVPKLLVDFPRPEFEYKELEEDTDTEIEIFKEEYLSPDNNEVLQNLLKRRSRRIEIVDRHTLGRLLSLILEVCTRLSPSDHEEGRYEDVVLSLQSTLASSIADLLMSSLVDVSYFEAAASGNGPEEENNLYEFGDINTQLKITSDVLEELFESYWAAVSLLPPNVATDVVRGAPVRVVLGWCVDRMKYSAPPKGMLRLLHVVVKGLQHELNTPMYALPTEPPTPHEVTFMALHRAHLQWFSQSTFEESFDLMDALNESVAGDLMARDLILLIRGLGDQSEQFQARTDVSLELLASIVATSVPKVPDLAVNSLRSLNDPTMGKQRIANGFPKSNRSNTGSFSRRTQSSSSSRSSGSMARSLYIHVVLASCFDKFDSLGRDARRKGGPSYMGEKLDAFVEHAALTVRCLHACARSRNHREYVGAILGDVFGTCLAMQDHADGRVRLAGFEIFAAALDVLFLAQKAMVLVPPQPKVGNSDVSALGAAGGASIVVDNINGVTELSSNAEKDSGTMAPNSTVHNAQVGELNRFSFPPPASNGLRPEDNTSAATSAMNGGDMEKERELQIQTIFAEGGSCLFEGEDASSSDLAFEERGWQMLCAFVTSSLGIGKYVDFVVQRACLEYLKGCMLNALRGRSTGASVIAFDHIGLLWDAVNRLVGSSWRTLNALAMWVVCALLNVSIYSSIMAKGRGATRQRSAQLNEFVIQQVFPTAYSLLKSGTRETRVWGMRLLEVYIRARDLNTSVVQAVPSPPGRILRALDSLKHDWNGDVRATSQSLLELHFTSLNKKQNSQTTSFTTQAQNFMSLKRHQLDDGTDGSDLSKVELWFPPLPKPIQASEMEIYCRSLEAFANAEIEGGEETDLVGAHDEKAENEDEFGEEYEEEEEDEEEEEYEFEDSIKNESNDTLTKNEADEMEIAVRDEDTTKDGSLDNSEDDAAKFTSKDMGDSSDSDGSERSQEEIETDLQSGQEEPPDVEINKEVPVTPVESDDEEEEVDEDHEFSSLSATAPQEESAVKQLSEAEDNEASPAGIVSLRGNHYNDDDDDDDDDEVVEDDEVVDVTDADDVLSDIDSVSEGAKQSSNNGGEARQESTVASLRKRFSLGLGSGSSPAPPGSGAFPRLKASLNPDLDERVQVLRRKGSFTSRPTSSAPIDEGDAPKLAKRRSVDAVGFLATSEQFSESKGPKAGPRDSEDGPPGGSSGRLFRRKSAKGTSPKVADAIKSKSFDSSSPGNAKGGIPERNAFESNSQGSSRLVRRKSLKSSSGKTEEMQRGNPGEQSQEWSRRKNRGSSRDPTGGEFLGLSPKGSRLPRGVQLDDEGDELVEARPRIPSASQDPNPVVSRARSASEARPGGSKPSRRSLPRAPAFVKGGGLQRKASGGAAGSSSGAGCVDGNKDGPSLGGMAGKGLSGAGASVPRGEEFPAPSRGKLPRARSQHNRPPRPESVQDGEGTEKKVDRSQRFSKREPQGLPFGKDAGDVDKDLFGELGLDLDMATDFDTQLQEGDEVPEALQVRSPSGDDGPSSGPHSGPTRRKSKRNIFDSEHYKSLLDEVDMVGSADDSPRSLGLLRKRDADKRSPRAGSKKNTFGSSTSDSDKDGGSST